MFVCKFTATYGNLVLIWVCVYINLTRFPLLFTNVPWKSRSFCLVLFVPLVTTSDYRCTWVFVGCVIGLRAGAEGLEGTCILWLMPGCPERTVHWPYHISIWRHISVWWCFVFFTLMIFFFAKLKLLNCQTEDKKWHVTLICIPSISEGDGLSFVHWTFRVFSYVS